MSWRLSMITARQQEISIRVFECHSRWMNRSQPPGPGLLCPKLSRNTAAVATLTIGHLVWARAGYAIIIFPPSRVFVLPIKQIAHYSYDETQRVTQPILG